MARPRAGKSRRMSPRTRFRLALAGAGLCVVAFFGVWVLAAFVPATHLRDATLLLHFTELERHPAIADTAHFVLDLLSPLAYTGWALLILAVALLRRRPRTALVLLVMLPAAPLSTELLKPLLAHPHAVVDGWHWIGAASYPSGHVTAATTLALGALIVAPAGLRPTVAALDCLFVGAVGLAVVILAWHMPSDVVGGCLLASLFALLAIAALSREGRSGSDSGSLGSGGSAAVGARVP